jgi:hypothetical protein
MIDVQSFILGALLSPVILVCLFALFVEIGGWITDDE